MSDVETALRQGTAACGLTLTPEQEAQLFQYMHLVLEWNTKINLTAITDPEEFVQKHFVDSLWPLQWLKLAGTRCVDVGTGAGFPGLPLKLAVPDVELTLLDSLQKRLTVLEDICGKLGVQAETVHARAEEAGRRAALREQYDYVFARAVAPLPVLCEYCLPLVKRGGYFCAWKGPAGENELAAAHRAIQALGGSVTRDERYTLPDGSTRTFLMVKRVHPCPEKYPRAGGKIKKEPLGGAC